MLLGLLLLLLPAVASPFELLRGDDGRFGVADAHGVTRLPAEFVLLHLDSHEVFPLFLAEGRSLKVVTVADDDTLVVRQLELLRDVREKPAIFPLPVTESGVSFLIGTRGEDASARFGEMWIPSGIQGYYFVRRDGLVGMLDQRGETLVEPRYDTLSEEWYFPRVGVRAGVADLVASNGTSINEVAASWIEDTQGELRSYRDAEGRMGLMTRYGKLVVRAQFQEVVIATDKLLLVKSDVGWGLHTTRGTERIPAVYEKLNGPYHGVFRAREPTRVHWFDARGREVSSVAHRPPADGSLSRPKGYDRFGPEAMEDRYRDLAIDEVALHLDEEHRPWHLLSDPKAVALMLLNATAEPVKPRAADSSVLVSVEAKLDDQWVLQPAFERSISCGNSYMAGVVLGPHEQLVLPVVPPREGRRTELRYVVFINGEPIASPPFWGALPEEVTPISR